MISLFLKQIGYVQDSVIHHSLIKLFVEPMV